ncbi:MAG: class I SAM-dependent methyltransferase [Chloroflexi bacterium]|nr:class I SAM-dependent methyltransferase [Chloroflexota bacterium]
MPNRNSHLASVEYSLVRLALALGAVEHGGPLSRNEQRLAQKAVEWPVPGVHDVQETAEEIREGGDPLGEQLIAARPHTKRRRLGQVFTPKSLIGPMVDWTLERSPTRVVDAGCGSGRFALEISRRSNAEIIAIDTDPLATLLTRAGLAALGRDRGASVLNADYTQAKISRHQGRTAFIGNPPYVRHHDLTADAKAWARLTAQNFGIRLSGLAGLHAHFFLATALHGRPGDVGCLVTSSEWLDVNYGDAVRQLLLNGLGGRSIQIVEPAAFPFGDTATTAVVTCFAIGSRPQRVRMRTVRQAADLPPLHSGRAVDRKELARATRWSPLVRPALGIPEGYIQLGEICRVHRGQVTGANATWVIPTGQHPRIPERYLLPSVTRARELIEAGERLESTEALRRVIDLPADLGELAASERSEVEEFLKSARADGVADGYVARNRRAWWSVGLREPAPLLATYMARRRPAFVRNAAGARHINIAHGIYPREPLSDRALYKLAEALRTIVDPTLGRTYAGGLVKFEPREMERIPVPSLERLLED